jgi:signal transduction histidine kinase
LRSKRSAKTFALLRNLGGVAAAAALPWFATQLTVFMPKLHSTPLLFGLVAVVLFTLRMNLPTGLVACAATALGFNYFILPPNGGWTTDPLELLHTVWVLAVAVGVALLCHRQTVIRLRLHHALLTQQAQAEALMDAQRGSNSVAWRMNAEDRRFRWATGGAAIFGRPFSEMIRIGSLTELIVAEDRTGFYQALEDALHAGTPFRIEFRVLWPEDGLHWIEARGAAAPGDAALWRGVMVDVTERKQAELALLNAEKLATAGRVSSTVAHEINNPLEAVTNLIFLAAEDPGLSPETRSYLMRADSELARLGGIARHSLDFARKDGHPGPGDLTEVAEDVVVLFQSRCRSRAGEIRITGRAKRLPVAAPADELRQIVTNLVANACDAMPHGGGLVEVELSADGKSAVLEVRDNGSGIAPEHRGQVFDPFFTTKGDVGTGIGLTVARELVERNGGRILIVNSGPTSYFRTTFRLELPRA